MAELTESMLRQDLRKLIEVAATCQKENSEEWMDYLMQQINRVIDSQFPAEPERLARAGQGFEFCEVRRG